MSVSGYRGDINVYTPVRPIPPSVYVPPVIVSPYRPVPPSVDVWVPSRPAIDIHTSRKGNEVIRDYNTGTSTTIVEHGKRAGEVIHGRIR